MWWYNQKLMRVMFPPSGGDGWTCDRKPPYCVLTLNVIGRHIVRAELPMRSGRFLADRTIGRAIGTVCRLSVVCRLWRFVFWQNGWTDLHEIFREGVEWPWDNLTTFWVNSGKPCDADYEKTAAPICMNARMHHRFCIDRLLWGSTVGHPSDSWTSY